MRHSVPHARRIFLGCFIALVACAFGFVTRSFLMDEWAQWLGWDETQKGIISAIGLWPFAISIFLFSLVIDRFGYGRAAFVGFVLHVVSTLIIISARSFEAFFIGWLLFGLAAGTVEAYINPVVATMYSDQKAKWLNILHAAWPAGSVLAGLIVIAIAGADWRVKIGLTLLPTLLYGGLLAGCKFPVSERVAAGVSYRDMLRDFGGLGAFIVTYLIVFLLADILKQFGVWNQLDPSWQPYLEPQDWMLYSLVPAIVAAFWFGSFVGSAGRFVFFVLCLVMIPLATTELGIDSWITDLMAPETEAMGLNKGWVLVYTMAIMAVLRLCAGPIVERITPITLLITCAALAACGLMYFSKAAGWQIFLAATIYGIGKTFFWPTMLAIASERFPRGGALTLNAVGAVGMLGFGVGNVFLGTIQDKQIETQIVASDRDQGTRLQQYLGEERTSFLGKYRPLPDSSVAQQSAPIREQVKSIKNAAKKQALVAATAFPVIMLTVYILLWLHFRSQGGYRAERLEAKQHR